MNNWLIFRASFFHLLNGESLYQLFPNEHHDLYKYSPTFALFIAPLSILPTWLGAIVWNLVGTLLFILAILELPISDSTRKGIFWLSLPEFIGSTQGFQSNIHMLALVFLFFARLEKGHHLSSSLSLLASFFIKIFGLVAGSLFLFYLNSRDKLTLLGKTFFTCLVLFIVLSLIPALVVGTDSLIFQYQEWLSLLKQDAGQSYGFSVMGFVHAFTGLDFPRLPVQIVGALSLVISFIYFRNGDQQTRLLGLVSLCYFLIVFNHKSESPTFITAMAAFGIHQALIKNQKLRKFLIAFTLICVSLMYSDLFRFLRTELDFYCVKVWPFLVLYPMALLQLNKK